MLPYSNHCFQHTHTPIHTHPPIPIVSLSYPSPIPPLFLSYPSPIPAQPAEFHVDEAFMVSGVGTVVAGTLFKGTVEVGDKVMMGPSHLGEFRPAVIKSIHSKQLPVRAVQAGQSCR